MPADFRFALRQLAKTPGFTLIAVLTLALGIGSATTAFSALNALLLRPLPLIQHQDRMLWVNEAVPAKGVDSTDICAADFLDWRQRTRTLSALWLYDSRTIILTGTDVPERVLGCGLGTGAFAAMGVKPILGRDFRAEDESPKAAPVALLGYGLWQRRFGGAREVLGRTIRVNGQATTVVGVMPPGWRYPETAELWVPLRVDPADARRGFFEYGGHAMLRPGVTLAQARAEFATISGALAREFPATNDGLVAVLRPVREQAAEDAARLTQLLFGAVMFVFLIACANVASLLLARGSGRTQEIAVRLALGATRARLLRQLLVESALLGLLGGVGGLLVGLWGNAALVAAVPVELPFWLRFDFDPRVYGFVAGLSLLGSLLFGLAPAWQASRPEVLEAMKEGGRGASGGGRSQRLRSGLVAAEIALALVLLVGAGLLLRSFFALQQVKPGFDARDVLTFRVGFPPALTHDQTKIDRFFHQLLPRLAALPGVESAGATSALPGIGWGGFNNVLPEGRPEPKTYAQTDSAMGRHVTPGYFATLRIPRAAGRWFADTDDAAHPRVAIVDEAFAHRFFPSGEILGRRFRTETGPEGQPRWLEIVGVVGNVRRSLDYDEPTPTYYVPYDQSPENFMSVALRVRGSPATYAAAVRAAVLAVDKDMPIYSVTPLAQAIGDHVWIRRFFGWLFTLFAGLALFLASVGVYGVTACAVAQRTREIGVRVALGAQAGDVIRLVLRQGAGLVATGLAAGTAGAYFVADLLAANLYGVAPHDAATFLLVPLILAAAALAACYLPSRRATKIDPIIALRSE